VRPHRTTPARAILLGLLVVCLAFAAWVRLGHDQRVLRMPKFGTEVVAEEGAWFSDEPDGLYHMRRVQRALQEGGVAATDPKLNAPDGAAIPWPPYADMVHAALLAPFAPSGDAQQQAQFIETRLAWFPFIWSLCTVALLVIATARLTASVFAAGIAGMTFAGQYAAAHYSAPGIADHHAWVSLLNTLALVLCMLAWPKLRGMGRRKAAVWGALAGAVMGLSLGSWVASLLWLGALQLAMGILLLRDHRAEIVGLRAFALSFHIAAALLLLPAILASPWRESHAWMVVNLSWFHFAELLAGAVCFAVPRRKEIHPWLLPVGMLVVAAGLVAMNIGPGAGIREGLAWVSRGDEFMSGIAESEPLLGSAQGSFLSWTSWSYFLLPIAFFVMLRELLRAGRLELLPLLVLLPLAAAQSWTQIRFAEALAPVAALAFALSFKQVFARAEGMPATAQALLACLLGLLLVPDGALRRAPAKEADLARNAHRHLVEWVGLQTARAGQSVLAPWDWGHAIEWSTPFASVATNFGSYVGETGYRAPSRFFLATDARQAQQVLETHQVRYVIRPSRLILSLQQLQRGFGDGLRPGGFVTNRTDAQGRERSEFTPAWFDSMAACLGYSGYASPSGVLPGLGDPDGPDGPRPPLSFLRLVAVSPAADPHPGLGGVAQPFGLIWEHVQGARVQADLLVGQQFEVELGIQAISDERSLLGFLYRHRVAATAAQAAEIRVPYNTALSNGQCSVDYARWRVLDSAGAELRSGEFVISEEAVQLGETIRIES